MNDIAMPLIGAVETQDDHSRHEIVPFVERDADSKQRD